MTAKNFFHLSVFSKFPTKYKYLQKNLHVNMGLFHLLNTLVILLNLNLMFSIMPLTMDSWQGLDNSPTTPLVEWPIFGQWNTRWIHRHIWSVNPFSVNFTPQFLNLVKHIWTFLWNFTDSKKNFLWRQWLLNYSQFWFFTCKTYVRHLLPPVGENW